MSLITKGSYRFDRFELEPSRRLLTRGGDRVAVSPKSFEVLLYLVQHAGQVVLKEELLKAVWPDSFVEESNLTQHIFWLRKALGDKSGYISTIPGRGYEFTATVDTDPEKVAGPEAGSASRGPETGFTIKRVVERTSIVVEETEPFIEIARPEGRTTARRWWVITGVALAAAGAGAWGAWWWMDRTVPGDHHEIVVADFDNSTGEPDLDKPLKTLLTIDLNQSPMLLVAGESDTRKVMKLMNLPADATVTATVAREVCERLNDQAVLAGAVSRIGQKYLITVSASDCSDGRSLVQTKAEADTREGVIRAVDTAASEMRKRLGEPLRSHPGNGQQLLLAHTFSLEALKAYSQARALHQRLKFSAAVPLYRKAIELDPNFADAYAQLGNCYNNMGEGLEGRKAMAKAYELRDQADETDRLRIVAMYEYWRTGDRHEAIRNYQNWTRLYPLSTNAWVLLGEFQASVGRTDLAVDAAKHAVANNPNSAGAAQDLARWQRSDGQLEDAKKTCNDAFKRGLDSLNLHRTLLDVAYLEHDAKGFDDQIKWYKEKAEDDDRESMEADYDASQGRMKSAVAHWSNLADAQMKSGLTEAALEVFSGVPEMEAESGMLREARAHLKRFEAEVALMEPSQSSVIVGAAEAGEKDLAERKLKYLLDNGKEDSDVRELFGPEGRAAIAMAAGRPEEAIAAMQPTSPFALSDPSVAATLGVAYLAAKQPQSAEREFRKIIERPFTSGISPNVPMAHLGLARALALEGNRDAARQEYETFFTVWKNADPDLPVVVEAHKEYLSLVACRREFVTTYATGGV
jgi:DNA-binding winged helix-turn-helix (wHTH) protein/tetratricopeptide (TPR) repeat protein